MSSNIVENVFGIDIITLSNMDTPTLASSVNLPNDSFGSISAKADPLNGSFTLRFFCLKIILYLSSYN